VTAGKTTATAKEEADPCGMTTRKAKATARATATARAKEEADPCGMTTRKARATAKATARATATATEEADSRRE